MTYKKGLEILKKGDTMIPRELYRLGGMNMLTDVLNLIKSVEIDKLKNNGEEHRTLWDIFKWYDVEQEVLKKLEELEG